MKLTSSSTPHFVAEALQGTPDEPNIERDAAALLEAWAPMSNESASPAGLERLTAAISEGPQRFAPFFDQLQALYQRDEAAIVELLRDGPWNRTVLPGVSVRSVQLGPGLRGSRGRLTLFRPGTRFPKHTHGGRERVLVLMGALVDSVTHQVYGPGDLQEMPGGTSHGFTVDQAGPCIAASVHDSPFRFDSWGLRLLARILGR